MSEDGWDVRRSSPVESQLDEGGAQRTLTSPPPGSLDEVKEEVGSICRSARFASKGWCVEDVGEDSCDEGGVVLHSVVVDQAAVVLHSVELGR
jgi:hypothetical protein